MNGPFEIVSLVGTLSQGGHLHISLSDADGHVIGGHVMGDLIVYTTAEIMAGECCDAMFTREPDSDTGYDELVVNTRWCVSDTEDVVYTRKPYSDTWYNEL